MLKRLRNLSWKVYVPAVLVAAVVVLGGLELSGTTHFLHTKKPAMQQTSKSDAPQGTKVQDTGGGQSGASPAVPSTNDVKVPSTTSPSINLLAPSGTFVNEYTATADEQMSSTCNTNAGVQCKIVFTKDGVSKSLPSQLTDASGNASWAWKPKDIGLTSGTWHIEAIAAYGSQTKTTNNDPLTLEIK